MEDNQCYLQKLNQNLPIDTEMQSIKKNYMMLKKHL